jgi:predicted nuclease of predicted toxin-antitoxin system
VDEDSQAHAQLRVLRIDGHDVISIAELDQNGASDPEVLDLAQSLERVLLTHNTDDFHSLHLEQPDHRGIMAVYRSGDPRKNMSHAHIAQAIRRLETSGVTIVGGFHVLTIAKPSGLA